MATRILLVDDHQILRDGLRLLLKAQIPGAEVVEACDGRRATQLASNFGPDLVIMDLSMPNLNGIDATRQIIGQNPQTKVIVLSAHSDERTIGEVFRAGASGFMAKDAAFEELTTAIRTIEDDQLYLSPQLDRASREGTLKDRLAQWSSTSPRLTAREREVLQLMSEGKATKEVAAALHLSVKTVETHRRQIMEKLSLYSVAELTKYAIREGLTSLQG
jgi:DNA-binding NarL/FixJ family response regulator